MKVLVVSIIVIAHGWVAALDVLYPTATRRSVLRTGFTVAASAATVSSRRADAAASAAAPSTAGTTVASRLNAEILTLPYSSSASQTSEGQPAGAPPNLYFPSWMAGTWAVTQTLRSTSTPLGLKYLGGPSGSESIAEQTLTEQRKQIDQPVNLNLRFVETKFGVVEDRLYNTRSRLDAFAGRKVVGTVEYADTKESNRKDVLAKGGRNDDPLTTTVLYFRGPAAQKTFSLARRSEIGVDDDSEAASSSWAGLELSRMIFQLTNLSERPPVTTDTEVIWQLQRGTTGGEKGSVVNGRLRIASYLNAQSDKLYFEARDRAVAVSDYSLEMRRTVAE